MLVKGQQEDDITTERNQKGACDANFFDSNNERANELREAVAEMALKDMLQWLDEEEYTTSTTTTSSGSSTAGGDMNYDDDCSSAGGASSVGGGTSRASTVGAAKLTQYRLNERVAIYDATNSTDKRRNWLLEMCTSPDKRPGKPTGIVFVESVCDDEELLEENYSYKVSSSPDFDGMPKQDAIADLRARVKKYEDQYETITDDSMSYIKVFNLSTKLMVNHIYGRMSKELVPALMAWHIGTRPVFLCRPGETMLGIPTDGEDYVARNKIDPSDPRFLDMSTTTKRKNMRGDSLGPNGIKFREGLLDFCYEEAHSFMFKRASVRDMAFTGTSVSGLASPNSYPSSYDGYGGAPSAELDDANASCRDPFPMRILTSTMPRAADTVNWEEYPFSNEGLSSLNPLDKGDYAGMELNEIKEVNPEWYAKLEQRPFSTR